MRTGANPAEDDRQEFKDWLRKAIKEQLPNSEKLPQQESDDIERSKRLRGSTGNK